MTYRDNWQYEYDRAIENGATPDEAADIADDAVMNYYSDRATMVNKVAVGE